MWRGMKGGAEAGVAGCGGQDLRMCEGEGKDDSEEEAGDVVGRRGRRRGSVLTQIGLSCAG